MSKLYQLFILTIILLLSLFQVKATAQSSDSAAVDSLELDRVVITASKISQTQRETTKPVQIIDRAEIERNAGRDLSQILNQQSGIRVNDSFGAPSNGRILYMQGAAATNTLILIDGLAINDPSGPGGLFDLRLLSTDSVERIEIIKGSQSTLYGTDAIAGVINIITRKGGEDPISGSGQLSYGSYDTFDANLGVRGAVSPDVRYNFSYNRESSQGISAAENSDDTGTFGNDGFGMNSFFGRVDLSPMENLTISPFIQYSTYDGDYDGGAFTDASNEFSLAMFSPRLQMVYDADKYKVNAEYSYTRTERTFVSSFGENEFEGQFHNADIFGNYSLTNFVKVLAGFNYQDFVLPESEDEVMDGQGNTQIVTIPVKDAQILSPYATLYLENWNGLSAELGYRLNNHSEYGNNSTYSIAPSYQLTDRVKLFGTVTTGFKAPTLDELFGQFGANPELDPQKSLYMSTGIEAYLFDQSLKVSAQYFNREIDDLITYVTFADMPSTYVNRDRQNDQGIELSADWIANHVITLGGWYNYLDGEITEEGENGSVTESNLIRRPEHSFGFRASVQPIEHLTIRLNGEFNGERADLYFNPNTFLSEDVALDSYMLVNVYAEYSLFNQQLTLFGDVKNLFNSDFTEVYGYNTIGTALKAGVRFNL